MAERTPVIGEIVARSVIKLVVVVLLAVAAWAVVIGLALLIIRSI